MVRYRSELISCIIILPVLFIISGCVDTISTGTGLLEGKISIGPICPVETVPPSPECLPNAETYKAYPVGVWTDDGKRRVALIMPALDGSYSIGLVPGQYLIKLDKDYGIGRSNLPVKVEISTIKNTILNINIDTGIR
jgi:hypothetical protein